MNELDQEVMEAFDPLCERPVRAIHMEKFAEFIFGLPDDEVSEHGKVVAAGFLVALYKFHGCGGQMHFEDAQ
jgi:hypothetical protein